MLLPRPLKKIVAVFRGGLSPQIITLSVALGFSFGFIPGFSGIHVLMLILFALLNIHLRVFLLTAGIGKSLCFLAAPLMYHLGIFVHENLAFLLNFLGKIPILGLTDYSRYSVASSVIFAPIIGIIAGLAIAKLVGGFRQKWVKLEEGSEAYKKWTSKKWVKVLDRLLIGKRTKDVRATLETKKPLIRKAGIGLAAIVLIVAIASSALIKNGMLNDYAESRLTRANGAEVNIGSLKLSALTGSIGASKVQITDSQNPENNSVSFDNLEGNAAVYNLLCGRVVLDDINVDNLKFNTERDKPGKIFESSETTQKDDEPFNPEDVDAKPDDIAKFEKYFKDAQAIKEKLARLQKWLPSKKSESDTPEQKKTTPQSILEYLNARAEQTPLARVIAKNVQLDNVRLDSPQFSTCSITMQNISDAPAAYGKPIKIDVKSADSDRSLNIELNFDDKNGGLVSGSFANLDMGLMQSQMKSDNSVKLEKGTASGQFSGMISKQNIDITVKARIEGLDAKSGGKGLFGLDAKTTSEVLAVMDSLDMTLRIVGPTSQPRIAFDSAALGEEFQAKLLDAGKKRLESEVQKQLGDKLGKDLPPEIKEVIDKPDDLIKGIGDLFGGKKDKK